MALNSDLSGLNLSNNFFPIGLLFTPFSPIAVNEDYPFTVLFILFSVFDFYLNPDGRISRKCIQNFSNYYLSIFGFCLVFRVGLLLFPIFQIKFIGFLIIGVVFFWWRRFFSSNWNALVRIAKQEGQEAK